MVAAGVPVPRADHAEVLADLGPCQHRRPTVAVTGRLVERQRDQRIDGTHVADDPLRAVVRGTSKALADTERYIAILIPRGSV